MKRRTKAEKQVWILKGLLWDLTHAAERIASKFGVYEDGQPKDWEEWDELRRTIREAKSKGGI